MSNFISEEIKVIPIIAPAAQAKGGNTTGAYLPCPPKVGSIDFVVRHGALAEGKKVTVEVYEASDASGTDAAEIESYEAVSTAGTGGATDGTITVSIRNADVTKGFVTVKVSNDSAVDAVPVDAFALLRKQYSEE